MPKPEIVAFVAGATGYTGREVVRALVDRAAKAVAHVRPDSARALEWRERFAAMGARVDETPWDEAAMRATLEALRPTHVFALLGTTRARAKAEGMAANEAYERIDFGLTASLVDAAAASGSPRVVYLSAANVSSRSTNAYVRARWLAEEHVRKSGLPWTIARPSFIAGPGRDESRPLERIGAVLADGVFSLAGRLGANHLARRYRSMDNTTLARGLVRVALDPECENEIVYAEILRQPGPKPNPKPG